MEKTKIVEFYNFTRNFNKNLKKKTYTKHFTFTKEKQVNKTTEAYFKNLVNYYSNELAIKPVKK